ncbi:hypothetical protein [Pseudomonas capeferrum]|nr:hypothetical protein [Pseudomonas capeferrum]
MKIGRRGEVKVRRDRELDVAKGVHPLWRIAKAAIGQGVQLIQ